MRKGFEKRFNSGDIVYWCHQRGHEFTVRWGMVDEQFSDAVVIDYLSPRETRRVNGIPIDEFENETRYKKLPKGWNYNTKLYEITYDPISQEEKDFVLNLKNPVLIKESYNRGFLVKDSTLFYGVIEEEITKEGYRIVKKYPEWCNHISHTSVRPDKVYFNYEDAKKETDDNIAEFLRQAALSDYDWSVEQIDKTLNIWKGISGALDTEVKQYRDWLLGMSNVEDLEVRMSGGNLQWKYTKNKRWNNIEL